MKFSPSEGHILTLAIEVLAKMLTDVPLLADLAHRMQCEYHVPEIAMNDPLHYLRLAGAATKNLPWLPMRLTAAYSDLLPNREPKGDLLEIWDTTDQAMGIHYQCERDGAQIDDQMTHPLEVVSRLSELVLLGMRRTLPVIEKPEPIEEMPEG